ncbi:MAG: MoaA/NifB/PqqE/SkfB family radical SAM enzyme [Gammaproteobacteria bacterium]|jgi:MoaA/NifB/PqqE/SkfB family radical SAM enzyme
MSAQAETDKPIIKPSPLYHYDEVRIIHLELTHRCNAACPMCARNVYGGADNPSMPLSELTLADIKKILLPDFVAQLKRVYACGNYGDPMVARDCLEVFRYLREQGPELNLCMHTNGSGRRAKWWSDLANIMKQGPHYMRFGIDGLEDTNHLYRRGTDWKTIMRSAEAFIAAGGQAEWDFLVFEHNEHQVEEARKLAFDMGFSDFFVRKTGRFIMEGELETSDRYQVQDKKGQFEYWLEQPKNPNYLNPAFSDLGQVKKTHGSYQNYLDEVDIKCKVGGKKRKIYLSAQGYVMPCCWLGATYSESDNPERRQFANLVDKHGGKQALDAKLHGLEKVIEGPLFQSEIPKSWNLESVEAGKLAICAKTCGAEYDPLDHQRDV